MKRSRSEPSAGAFLGYFPCAEYGGKADVGIRLAEMKSKVMRGTWIEVTATSRISTLISP